LGRPDPLSRAGQPDHDARLRAVDIEPVAPFAPSQIIVLASPGPIGLDAHGETAIGEIAGPVPDCRKFGGQVSQNPGPETP